MSLEPNPGFMREVRLRLQPLRSENWPGREVRIAKAKGWAATLLGYSLLGSLPFVISAGADPGPRLFIWSFVLLTGLGLLSSMLTQQLYRHPNLVPFAIYPADPAAVFRRQLAIAIRSTLLISAFAGATMAIAGACFSPATGWPRAAGGGLLLALGYAALALSYATAEHRWPFLRLPVRLAPPVGIAVLVAIKFSPAFETLIGSTMDRHGATLSSLLPTGWMILVWSAVAGLEPLHLLAALPPLAVAWAYLPTGIRHLASSYQLRDAILLRLIGQAPEDADDEFNELLAEAQTLPPSRGATAILDDIHARVFLQPRLPRPTGWIERWVWNWWTPRERTIAEFLRASWPSWSRRLLWAAGFFVLTPVTVAILHRFRPEWTAAALIPLGIGLLIALPYSAGFTLAPVGAPGAGFSLSPLQAAPIRFSEVLRLQWKCVVIRAAVLAPVLAAIGLPCAWILDDPLWTLPLVGAQLALAPIAIRPLNTLHRYLASPRIRVRGPRGYIAAVGVALVILVNLPALLLCLFPGVGLAVLAALAGFNFLGVMGAYRLLASGPLDACAIGETGGSGDGGDWD